jgi:hypothetical protein
MPSVDNTRTGQAQKRTGIAGHYLGLFGKPEMVTEWCVGLGVVGAIVVIVLAFWVSDKGSFWHVFDHVAAGLAVLGLLLALPALSYAVSTEHLARRANSRLDHLSSENRLVTFPTPPTTLAQAAGADFSGTTPSSLNEFVEPGHGDSPPVERAVAELGSQPSVDVEQILQRTSLESAIKAGAGDAAVRELLSQSEVLALGEPAGDTSVPGQGSESNILHFSIDEAGNDRWFMPVFTRAEFIESAVQRTPEWESYGVIELNGQELLAARDKDVTLVINPWSSLEFQLPPND